MAKKYLGQNFLFDPAILGRIVEVASLSPEDTVVEIGPGPGRLTRMLAERAGRVIAIEVDRHLYERLQAEFPEGTLELVYGDALEYPYESLPEFKVVANIPYYITTPIIFKILEHGDRLKSATLTIQKEVAERIVAGPGGRQYGVLSLMVQYYCRATLEFIIPRGAFRPVPKVDSAVIHLEVRDEPAVEVADEKTLFRVIKTAFSQRRKMLSNVLSSLSKDIRDLLIQAEIDPSRRAETLSIQDFARLSDLMRRGRPGPGGGPDR